jgi:hypothetical protein
MAERPVVEPLLSKCKALSSNPVLPKAKTKKDKTQKNTFIKLKSWQKPYCYINARIWIREKFQHAGHLERNRMDTQGFPGNSMFRVLSCPWELL